MSTASRPDGRMPDQLRPLKIELGVNVHAEGSCLIEMGRTRVWITAVSYTHLTLPTIYSV